MRELTVNEIEEVSGGGNPYIDGGITVMGFGMGAAGLGALGSSVIGTMALATPLGLGIGAVMIAYGAYQVSTGQPDELSDS